MLYIAWIVSLIIVFFLGYFFNRFISSVNYKIEILEEAVKQKVDKPEKLVEPPSVLIDVDDPIAEAKYQQEQLMRKLNDGQ